MTLEELEQFRHLKKEIKMLEKQIAAYTNQCQTFVSDSVLGSSPHPPFRPHIITVKSYADADYTDKQNQRNLHSGKLKTLQEKYTARTNALYQSLINIEDFIGSVNNSKVRQILEYRYVNGLSWNSVAKKVYGYPNGNTARMAVIRYLKKI